MYVLLNTTHIEEETRSSKKSGVGQTELGVHSKYFLCFTVCVHPLAKYIEYCLGGVKLEQCVARMSKIRLCVLP